MLRVAYLDENRLWGAVWLLRLNLGCPCLITRSMRKSSNNMGAFRKFWMFYGGYAASFAKIGCKD